MPDQTPNVRGVSAYFPQSLLRDDVRATITAVQIANDFGDTTLADEIDSSASSVANWRNRANDMSLYAWVKGLRRFGPLWGNRLLNRHGYAIVALGSTIVEAAGRGIATVLSKLNFELTAALEDGSLSDDELLEMGPTLDQAGPRIDALRERLRELRERRG